MLDRAAAALIQPAVERLAAVLVHWRIGANQLTLLGFALGALAAAMIASGNYRWGAGLIVLSRICDALDGAVARRTAASDAGGFLDITFDFLFYAAIPLAFAFADPARNALASAVLLAAFTGTMSSFLAFAVIAAKRQMANLAYPGKSFYFLGGLTEATETLGFLLAMCWWPQHFALLAYVFAALCAVTTATRVWWGWQSFKV